MFLPQLALKLALALLRLWFPAAPVALLEQFAERVAGAYNRFADNPDQLEFEIGAIRAEVKGALASVGILVDDIGGAV